MSMNKRHRWLGPLLMSCVASMLAVTVAGSMQAAGLSSSTVSRCAAGFVPGWHASPAELVAVTGVGGQAPIVDQTLRLVVHPHTRGDRLRVRLSNRYGEGALTVGPVYVGLVDQGPRLIHDSNRPVTFGGSKTVTVAAGADALSDPVDRPITEFQDVAVSIHVPAVAAPMTGHGQAMQTSYLSTLGDYSASEGSDAYTTSISTWPLLSGLDVRTAQAVNTVVTLGDSITDGDGSTPNANHRWPDFLAERLAAAGGHSYMAVANAGIGANQILRDALYPPYGGDSALRRFSPDVVAQPGVTDVILLEGTNDIGLSGASAEQIIDGMKQLAAQAHEAGLRIHVATQTPAAGATGFPGHSSAEAVATRDAVNTWIRTEWRSYFDSFTDFGSLLADLTDHTRLASRYDSGDGLHPNDAGYKRMADAIDLSALTGSPCWTGHP